MSDPLERPDTAVDLAREPPLRLGALEVVPALRQVRRGDQVVVLEPRVMQVLVVLARAEGQVVSRQSLVERCWRGRVVVDNAVARAISRLRALADGPGAGHFTIEAIPRVGYRLVPAAAAPATAPVPSAGTAGDLSPCGIADPAPRRRWLAQVGALALGTTGFAAVVTGSVQRRSSRDAEVDELLAQARVARRQSMWALTVQAAAFAEQAAERAPWRADAWGLLALVGQELAVGVTEPAHRKQWAERRRSALVHALAIDPSDRDVHAASVLTEVAMLGWADGERRLREGLQHDAENPDLLCALAKMLEEFGRWREAATLYQGLAVRHPLWALPAGSGADAWWSAGRIAAADAESRRAVTLWPTHGSVWEMAFRVLALTGRAEQALAFAERQPSPMPELLPQVVALAAARALASGKRGDADDASAAILEARHRRAIWSATAVQFLAALGREAEALQLLEAFLETTTDANVGRLVRRSFVLFRPPLRRLRGDARYAALLERTGLAEHWRRGGRGPDG